MKNKKIISAVFASMLLLMTCNVNNASAQDKMDCNRMKNCCMKKDGKMMCVKNGKAMPMEQNMTMKNGTKCMTNGDCILADGTKMKMKEGDCMNRKGEMRQCCTNKKDKDKLSSNYFCPMHPEITRNKASTCHKCGMDLEKKK